MAVKRMISRRAYGLGDNTLAMAPLPIIAQRDPTINDQAELGTMWINEAQNSVWVIASIGAGGSTWQTSPASGVGAFTSVTVNPGDIDVTAGDINIALGGLNVTAGNTVLGGNLTVAGTTTVNGDFDLASAALIDLTSTLNAAPSIYLHANGGVLEQIRIHADQGTSVNSIELDSDVGGITLVSGLASADAINLSATAGGVDIDGALQVNIASSQNAASAIVVNASAGGIDITAAGAATEDIDIVNTAGSININSGEAIADSMVLTSAGGLDFTVAGTGGLDVDMVNTAGSINITAGQAAAADAIVINASAADSGVQIQAGSAGILIGNQADCAVINLGDIVPTSARTITVSGGTVATAIADTVDIGPDGVDTNAGASKVVNINSGNITLGTGTTNIASGNRVSGTHTANLSTGTGTKTVNVGNADGLTTVNIDAITLINDSINVNTSINTGTSTGAIALGNAAAGALTLDTAAGISLDGVTASNFTITGASAQLLLRSSGGTALLFGGENAALTAGVQANGGVLSQAYLNCVTGTAVDSVLISSNAGGVRVLSNLAAANALDIDANTGGIDIDASLQINIDSAQAAVANAIRIVASAADGGIDIDSGTGGIAIDSTGAISIQGAAASDFSTTGAGIDLTLDATAGRVVVDGGEAAADAVRIIASDVAGGIDIDSGTGGVAIDSTAAFSIDGATASNVTVTGAAQDLTLSSVGGSVNITASQAAADAIVLNASNAVGGIDLITGGTGSVDINSQGFLSSEAGTATDATGPGATAAVTISTNVGVATLSNFTTAAGATLVLTVTNTLVSATSAILVSVSTLGANDAQIFARRVKPAAGSFEVTLFNDGAAALNGNLIVTFWVVTP